MKIVQQLKREIKLPEIGYSMLEYELLQPEDETGWGLRCRIAALGEEVTVAGVAVSRLDAERYLTLLADGLVTPITFLDVLYDLLP